MKLLFLSYDIAMHASVLEILEESELGTYTRWSEVQDVSEKGQPRLGTHIWPGVNSAMIVPVPEEKEEMVMSRIQAFNDRAKFEGIKAYCWKLDSICVK